MDPERALRGYRVLSVAALGALIALGFLFFSAASGSLSFTHPKPVDPGWAQLSNVSVTYMTVVNGTRTWEGTRGACEVCPISLQGGSHVSFPFLQLAPSRDTHYWINVTSEFFPVEQFFCNSPGAPATPGPIGCPYGYSSSTGPLRIGTGSSIQFYLNVSVPDPVPTPGIHATIAATVLYWAA